MSDRRDPPPAPDSALPVAVLAAWIGQSNDLLALTDDAGRLRWCNPAFGTATGLTIGGNLLPLAADDSPARAALTEVLQRGHESRLPPIAGILG